MNQQQTETPESEENATLELSSLSTLTLIVKVINPTGKAEVLSTSDSNLIPVGKNFNSTFISGKELGSLWRCDAHLSQGDSGSVKIDSIAAFVSTPEKTTEAHSVIVATPEVESAVTAVETPIIAAIVTPEASRKTPPEVKSIPVAMTLDKDISEWESDDYYVSPNYRECFKIAYNMLRLDPLHSVKIMLTGDPGYGKTTLAEKFAEFIGFHIYRMNCASIRDTTEWFYDQELIPVENASGQMSMKTVFTDSEFTEVLARGNCVMILDEFNRIESNMHNSLFPLLDDSGKTRIHHREYTVGPNVLFVGTVNLGVENAGIFLLDDALTNRFDMFLQVRPMPFDHECAILQKRAKIREAEAETIVKMATLLRENNFVCATRDTLKIAKIVATGATIRNAFEYVIIIRIPEDEHNAPIRKSVCDLCNKFLDTRGTEFASVS